MMKYILSVLLFLMAIPYAQAEEVFANKSGSNMNSCSTAHTDGTTAKLTITAALACIGSGGSSAGADDFVTVGAGNWGEDLTDLIPGGTSGHKFTLRCGVQNTCVFYGTIGFNVASSYIRITGFEATEVGGVYGGFNTSSHVANTFHDIEYDHLYIHDIQEFAFGGFSGAKSVWYHDNITDNTGTNCTYPGGSPPAPGLCHSLYVSSYSSDWIIENSVFRNNYVTGGYCVHIFYAADTSDPTEVPTNFIIRNNVIENCGNVSVGGNGAGIVVYGSGHQIYNNVIYNQPLYGILDRSSSATMDFNTIYNAAIYGIANQGGCTARNNLIIASGNAAFSPDDPTFDDCGTKVTNTTTGSGGSHFVNAGAGDFHLIPTSGALGAGTTISITVDKDGNLRASPPATGAYDTVGGGGGPTCGVDPSDPLSEDFEDTSTGSVDGANGGHGFTGCWTITSGTATVSSSPGGGLSGNALISTDTSYVELYRLFTTHTGLHSIKFTMDSSITTPNDYQIVSVLNQAGSLLARVAFDPSGNLVTDSQILVTGITANHPYVVEIKLDPAHPNEYAARVDGGSYLSFESSVSAYTGSGGIKFFNYATNAHTFRLDDIMESDGSGGGGGSCILTMNTPSQALIVGRTYNLDWAQTGCTGNVDITWLDGSIEHSITTVDVSSNPYSWRVNAPINPNSVLRITQGGVTDDSSTFSITGPTKARIRVRAR